jgi:hypothetical protein
VKHKLECEEGMREGKLDVDDEAKIIGIIFSDEIVDIEKK